MSSPILWENEDRTVVLIDIPRSISAAQGNDDFLCSDSLLSTEPAQQPFVTNEPRTAASKARLAGNTTDVVVHSEYQSLLQAALRVVKDSYQGDWCLSRPFVTTSTNELGIKRKRRKEDTVADDSPTKQETTFEPPHDLFSRGSAIYSLSRECEECPSDHSSFHANCGASPKQFDISYPSIDQDPQTYSFRIPPDATFSLSNCSQPRSFMNSIRNQAQAHDTPRHFDIILLDPPWPNRSVKRARKTPGTSYATPTTLDDVYQLLIGMDVDTLMAEDCLVGIWITNKPSIRELVLGEDGIFAIWGLELEEEWVWLKTTAKGEPISPIDSAWRKPYETLLIGRKRRDVLRAETAPTRRVIMSVPDLHSQKPCLKLLLEPMAAQVKDSRVLEIFARHLVAGWWSWGNECVKFNWDGYWRSPSSDAGQ
jgi:N6-adenosine-specific RNA methylase IME4